MLVFLILACVGVVFLLISAFFGGDHDVSADHEFHFEHGYEAAAGHEGGGSPSPFSTRVISLFVTAFGAVGAISRYYEASYFLSSLSGLVGGVLVGGIGYQIMRFFWKQQATSTVCSEDLINSSALPGERSGSLLRPGGLGPGPAPNFTL